MPWVRRQRDECTLPNRPATKICPSPPKRWVASPSHLFSTVVECRGRLLFRRPLEHWPCVCERGPPKLDTRGVLVPDTANGAIRVW